MQLAGKAAIVTGGGTGVGRATALALAREGCSVLINYSRSRDEAEQTAAEIEALGVKAWPCRPTCQTTRPAGGWSTRPCNNSSAWICW